MKKQLITAAALLTVGLISGCGSSGSMTSSQSGAAKSVIAGAVADGYLVNATVFLDKNYNYQLDVGEPSTKTKLDGSFSLSIDAADLNSDGKLKYPVVALAIADETYDLDEQVAGQPPKLLANSYVMSMHAVSVTPSASGDVTGSVKNFISPISTQIREMMETGTYTSVDAAIEALRAQMGMPPTTNMLDNYIANSNSSMSLLHRAARNIANLMGEQKDQVMPGNKLDVNRYRGMMGAIFSNMSSVKGPDNSLVMARLIETMRTTLPSIVPGQPFRNMSSSFRGGMMNGRGMRP